MTRHGSERNSDRQVLEGVGADLTATKIFRHVLRFFFFLASSVILFIELIEQRSRSAQTLFYIAYIPVSYTSS